MTDEQKNGYERTLKVTAIYRQFDERTQFTFEQFKKRDDVFKMLIHASDGMFELGDIVTLTIAKKMGAIVH